MEFDQKMENNRPKTRQFNVVHFQEDNQPYSGINYYVCVPNTWVTLGWEDRRLAAVVYPEKEDFSVTKQRVKNNEEPSDRWDMFVASLLYESDSFEDAERWIFNQYWFHKDKTETHHAVPRDYDLQCGNQKYSTKPRRVMYLKRIRWPSTEIVVKTSENANTKQVSSTTETTTIRDESMESTETDVESSKESTQTIQRNDRESSEYEPRLTIVHAEALTKVNIDDQSQQQPMEATESLNLSALKPPFPVEPTSTTLHKPNIEPMESTETDIESFKESTQTSQRNDRESSEYEPRLTIVHAEAHTKVNIDDQSQQQPMETTECQNLAAQKAPSPVMQTSSTPHKSNIEPMESTETDIESFKESTQTSQRNDRESSEYEPRLTIVHAEAHTKVNIDDQSQQQPMEATETLNLAALKLPSPVEWTLSTPHKPNIRIKDVRTLMPSPSSLPFSHDRFNQGEHIKKSMGIGPQNSNNFMVPTQPLPQPSTQKSQIRAAPLFRTNAISCTPVTATNPVPATQPRVVASQNSPMNYQQPNFVYQNVQQNLTQQYCQIPGQNLVQGPTLQRDYTFMEYRPSEITNHQFMRPIYNNLMNVPGQSHQLREIQNQARVVLNHRSAQQHHVNARNVLPGANGRNPTLQGLLNTSAQSRSRASETLSQGILNVFGIYPLNLQELQRVARRIPMQPYHPSLTNVLRNIADLQQRFPESSVPNASSVQSSRMDDPQNVDQQPRSQTQQVRLQDSAVSAATQTKVDSGCQTTVSMKEPVSATTQTKVDSGCQTTVSMKEPVSATTQMKVDSGCQTTVSMRESLSPPNNAASDSGIKVDHKGTFYETSERSTAPNFASHLKLVKKFTAACSRLSLTLRDTATLFDGFRDSFPEIIKLYQDDEKSNASENSATHSFSGNVTQEAPQVVEERRNAGPERGNTSNGNQESVDIVKAPRKTYKKTSQDHLKSLQFVPPPEYKSNDTRWTLRFQNKMSELVELMPKTSVYVRLKVRKHHEKKTNSYEKLARSMLHEVFNENALGVCATITEAHTLCKDSPGARPELDTVGVFALIHCVLEHAVNSGTGADVKDVINILDHEIKEMRAQYELKQILLYRKVAKKFKRLKINIENLNYYRRQSK